MVSNSVIRPPRPLSLALAAGAIVSSAMSLPGSELPGGGGLQYLPELGHQQIELSNPGFEDGCRGWEPKNAEAFRPAGEVEGVEAHSGKGCIEIDAGKKTKYSPNLRLAVNGIIVNTKTATATANQAE